LSCTGELRGREKEVAVEARGSEKQVHERDLGAKTKIGSGTNFPEYYDRN
jgi:hypothetical protein